MSLSGCKSNHKTVEMNPRAAPITYQTDWKKNAFGKDPGGREQRDLLGQSAWTWATVYELSGAGQPC